jgi:protein gp37
MTFNPIVGCSKKCHDCDGNIWCYAYWQAKRMQHKCDLCYKFIPHIHEERLIEPYNRKKPTDIFVCSMGEFFDKNVPQSWRDEVLLVVKENPQHTFMFLTKQPGNIQDMKYPANMWIGISVNGKYDTYSQKELNYFLIDLKDKVKIRFISFEPYLREIEDIDIYIKHVDWIIAGGLTGHKKFSPPTKWIDNMVEYCEKYKKRLFIKRNCNYSNTIRQRPEVET